MNLDYIEPIVGYFILIIGLLGIIRPYFCWLIRKDITLMEAKGCAVEIVLGLIFVVVGLYIKNW